MTEGIRLQKVLAAAGVGSRRKCEALIDAGRVRVDGQVVSGQGMRVDPATAIIHVDGKRIPVAPDTVVLVMNKPAGVLTTMDDDRGRPCVGDLLQDRGERLFHVGRLDADTSGLLLFTNDGDLGNRLAHPRHSVAKTYVATVDAPVPRGLPRRLREGVLLDDGPARADRVHVRNTVGDRAMVEITLHEGRNRIVRRMFEAVDRPVRELVRIRIGPLSLGDLRPGQVRELTGAGLRSLYQAAGL